MPACAQIGPGNAVGSLGAGDHRRHNLAQLRLQHAVASWVEQGGAAVGREGRERGAAGRVPGLVRLAAGDAEGFLQEPIVHGYQEIAPAQALHVTACPSP